MWKVSVFITMCCLFIGTAHAASIDCNIDECRKPMKIYEELGCKPIYGSKSCCPKRFECPDDMKVVKNENKCTFEGNDYKVGEVLPRNLTTESKCVEDCICSRFEEEPAKFLCTNSDCGISSFKVPGCINIYGDLNECCSTSIVCDDGEKKNLATCWDSEVEYHEGEKFISKSNPCYECLCHKDFDNTTIIEKNPHCHKLNCEIELKHKSFIQRGCLPIFENDKCCPVDWKCFDSAKKSKKVVKRSPYEDDNSSDEDNSSEESNEEIDELQFSSTTKPSKIQPLEVTQFLPPFEDKTEPTISKEVEDVKETIEQSLTTEKTPQDDQEEKDITTTQKSSEETTSSLDELTTISSTEQSSYTESSTEGISETTASKVETIESVSETESTTVSIEKAKDAINEESEEKNSEEDDDENIFGGDIKKEESAEENIESSPNVSIAKEDDITTQVISTEAEESTTKSSIATEKIPENSSQPISTEEPITITTVEDNSDDSDVNSTEIPENTTAPMPVTEEPKVTSESNTETIKLIEESKTTEATVTEKELTPPVPTQIDMILTTLKELKEYVSKLTLLPTTRTSETEPPASFVNFTVSRSLPITENVEETSNEHVLDVRSLSKRSVDQKSVYIKYLNKEKGCTVGTQFYKVGEEIKTDDKCIKCYCNYSPIGHCIKSEKCV